MLLLPKKCLVFLKRQPLVSLADVTLLVGVHKYLLNFWFKRVEDCYIRVSQIVKMGTHPKGKLLHSKSLSALFKQKSEGPLF